QEQREAPGRRRRQNGNRQHTRRPDLRGPGGQRGKRSEGIQESGEIQKGRGSEESRGSGGRGGPPEAGGRRQAAGEQGRRTRQAQCRVDRKSTRLNSSHV